jgi:aspartate racemase
MSTADDDIVVVGSSGSKVIGLIGGLSWESSAVYYRLINEEIRRRLGPPHSARIVLWSFDFEKIERLQHQDDWTALSELMSEAGRRLVGAGAELVLICSNTMHRLAPHVESAIDAPIIHIADVTGAALVRSGYNRVCLLGTRFTMEASFYRERLQQRYGLAVLTPSEQDRETVHQIIYRELVAGTVRPQSRKAVAAIIERLASAGAQAVILGCTELMMLISQADSALPMFDTTALHASAAVEAALTA